MAGLARRGKLFDHRIHIELQAIGDIARVLLREHRMFDGRQKFEYFGECPAFFAEISEITAAKLAIDRVTKKRHRVIDELLNGFAPTLHHKIGWVEVIGKRDGAQVNLLAACFGEHAFVTESRRAIGCALTSLVAVKQIHDLVLGMPRQHANMLHGKRGTQRATTLVTPASCIMMTSV